MKLRLMTANLLRGRADPDALVAMLERERPDVLAVQELSPVLAEAIASVLSHGQLEPEEGYDGMGVALRRPGRVGRLPLARRDGRSATLLPEDWPGLDHAVEILNLHVPAPHTLPQWRALAERRAQLRALERYLDEALARPLVVCGDLNATPAWPVHRRLTRRLSDLAAEDALRRGVRPQRTWGPWPGAPRLLRIDHVLGSRVNVLETRRVEIRGSDHSALVADLEL